jgi:hypothetical protein
MDEAHIHVQHGTSFCSDIRALQVEFFRKIFGNQPIIKRPRLIILSATPKMYTPLLSKLMMMDLSGDNSLLCGSPDDFQQREISMSSFLVLRGLSSCQKE